MDTRIYNPMIHLSLLVLLAGCAKEDSPEAMVAVNEVPIPVAVEPLELQPFQLTYRSIGRVVSDRQVNLFFQVPGIVETVLVLPGDHVTDNQSLAEIDSDQYEANHTLAKSALAKAENDLLSSRDLLKSQVISKDQFDQSQLANDNAQASYIQAKKALENTVLRAPFPGRIIYRSLEKGDVVAPGVALKSPMVIADMERLKVVVPVPESEIGRIRTGQAAKLRFKTYPDRVFIGSVSNIGLATKTLSNTFDVEIRIKDSLSDLRLGLIAEVDIVLKQLNAGLVLPLRLIHDDGNQKFIYRVEGDYARRVNVDLKEISGSSVLVSGELSVGDTLIVAGHNDVKEGSKVTATSVQDKQR